MCFTPRPDFEAVLALGQYESQQQALAGSFQLFFPGEAVQADLEDKASREKSSVSCSKHLLFVNLLKLAKAQIVLADLQQQMQGPLPESARMHIGPVLDALLALVAWARDSNGRPFITLRVQLWMRELRRMVASVRLQPEQIDLRSASDIRREPGKLNLPLIQCTDCHTTGWLSRNPRRTGSHLANLDEIYNSWFAGQPQVLRLYANRGLSRPQCEGVVQRLCTACGNLQVNSGECSPLWTPRHYGGLPRHRHAHQQECRRTRLHLARLHLSRVRSPEFQMLLGARNATLGAVVIEQTWAVPSTMTRSSSPSLIPCRTPLIAQVFSLHAPTSTPSAPDSLVSLTMWPLLNVRGQNSSKRPVRYGVRRARASNFRWNNSSPSSCAQHALAA